MSSTRPTTSQREQDVSTSETTEVLKKTVQDLQSAAMDASKDLIKLLHNLHNPSTKSMDLALDHLLVQDSAAQDLQEVTSQSVEAGRSVVNASLELLEVLEETEVLNKKVNKLRNTVDGIVEQLQADVTSRS